MTREEAAELILEAHSWDECLVCRGMGYTEKTKIEVGDAVSYRNDGSVHATTLCRTCKGTTGFINSLYAKACAELGLEIPQSILERTWSWEERVRKSLGVATGLPMGFITGIEPNGLVRVRHGMEQQKHIYQSPTAEYLYEIK